MDSMTWIALLLGALGYLAAKFLDNMTFHLRSGTAIIEARRDLDLEIIEIVIFEIRDLACDYWCSPRSGVEQMRRSASINGRFTFLASRIAQLFESHSPDRNSIQSTLDIFCESCTGDEFDEVSQESKPEKCVDIELYAYALSNMITEKRRKLRRRIIPF